ncbi:MAG: YraN family protein [Candidatus Egerieousia sp.]|nr:YraN family protein [bacterium]MDY3293280.1 YraN family protein [Candidatus Egerieousia sp.]
MERRQLLGRIGEEMALHHLEELGYRLLARNWRSGHKELDLVMEDEKKLRIIEVRCRSLRTTAGGVIAEPSLTVNRIKQRRLISAANAYAKRHNIGKEIVFDIVSIIADGSTFHLEYLPEAFSATI